VTVTTVNPVWASFCARKIEEWIDWMSNIQIDSYLELSERFIALNPHYVPSDNDLASSSGQTFERLMIDEQFISSLSDQGLLVWANSGVGDFVLALDAYSRVSIEIRRVTRFFAKHLHWFERVYAYLRAELIADLREQGRRI
jgi:hypothetical protein|tara:strand:+ start:290 stop:715 length:426 start_codon:yes stop_codon:yes gene_type:complete